MLITSWDATSDRGPFSLHKGNEFTEGKDVGQETLLKALAFCACRLSMMV